MSGIRVREGNNRQSTDIRITQKVREKAMKGKKIQKCLAAILAVSVGVTSVPWPDSRVYAAEELTSENESDSMLEQEGTSETEEGEYAVSSEIMEERTERKTVFDLGDGRKK